MLSKYVRTWIVLLVVVVGLTAVPLVFASFEQDSRVKADDLSCQDNEMDDNGDCAATVDSNDNNVKAQSPTTDLGGGEFELFIGTGTDGPVSNSVYLMDVDTNISMTVLVSTSIGGAVYDPFANRILFTSSTADEHESDLWQWVPGTMTPTLLGVITTISGDLSIDGLAMVDGFLYGVHQSSSTAGPEGLYQINLNNLHATQLMTWTESSRSINGLEADPRNGRMYALDDTSNSLVEILSDGTFITVTDYFTVETDLDGLAIGDDGRAYIVPDDTDPGDIYVYNLDTGMYESSLRAPWIDDDAASGAAYIYVLPPAPTTGLILTKTVGTDPSVCATTTTITVTNSTEVVYCYQVTNTGDLTVTEHGLIDSALGSILADLTLTLGPGHTVWVTQSASVSQTTVNTATWTAVAPPAIHNDPLSDTFTAFPIQSAWTQADAQLEGGGFVPDISQFSAGAHGNQLVMNVQVVEAFSPGGSGQANALVGVIDLDTDRSTTTGEVGVTGAFCPDPTGMGVDYAVSLFDYVGGTAPILDTTNSLPVGTAVVISSSHAITVSVPLTVIRSLGVVDTAVVIGNELSPTDCAPNGGVVTSNHMGTAVAQATATVIHEPFYWIYMPFVTRDDSTLLK